MYNSVPIVAETRNASTDGEAGSEECLTRPYHHELPPPTRTKLNRSRDMAP